MLNDRRFIAAMAIAVAAPALAQADPAGSALNPIARVIAFTTIARGVYGGPMSPRAQHVVIRDRAAYDAFFGAGRAPASPAVNFAREEVLAVAMGTQHSGGYSIEITRVIEPIRGIVGGFLFCHYEETAPGGGMTTMGLTQPYHVVKIAKSVLGVTFVKDAVARSYSELKLSVRNASARTDRTITLKDDGSVHVVRSSPVARYAPIDGAATAAELRAVADAFAKAQVETLPSVIPDPRMILGGSSIALDSRVGGRTYTLGASLDFYAGWRDRVKPLVDALDAIEKRLLGIAAPRFDDVSIRTYNSWTQVTVEVSVAKDGRIHVRHRKAARPPLAPLPWEKDGLTTAAELKALSDAWNAADVATLPKTLPAVIFDGTTFDLSSSAGTQLSLTHGFLEGFGSYRARLKPLVDALLALDKRLSTGAP